MTRLLRSTLASILVEHLLALPSRPRLRRTPMNTAAGMLDCSRRVEEPGQLAEARHVAEGVNCSRCRGYP
jgi:hypothetical protein